MRLNASSNCSRGTGRFSSAFSMPERIFASSNASRVRSPFTTTGMTSSAVSNVVNRSPQDRHSRRRRIWRPSPARRESVTFVSIWPQKGQYMRQVQPYDLRAVYRKAPAELYDPRPDLLDGGFRALGVD